MWCHSATRTSITTSTWWIGLGQAGGAVVRDLDGDSKQDTIVTGYEDNVVYIFTQ